MPKRIANGLTLLSAVVCGGSLLLLGWSLFRYETLTLPIGPDTSVGIGAIDAQLLLWHGRGSGGLHRYSLSADSARPGLDLLWRALKGIRGLHIGWGSYAMHRVLVVPLWLIPVLTAVVPVRWWRAHRARRARGFPLEAAPAEGELR